MIESRQTARLLKLLRNHPLLRDAAYIQKHADRLSRGVPDFSVSVGIRTLWVECKIEGERPTRIQQWTLDRIGDGAMVVWFGKAGAYAWYRRALTGWMELGAMAKFIVERILGDDRD